MRVNLLGVRRVDMTDDSGRRIVGYSCFVGYPTDGVEGQEIVKVFVSDQVAKSGDKTWYPSVGKPVNIDFNQKGKVVGVW